jgi:hypothetical protein
MRYIFIGLFTCLVAISCKKNNDSAAPVISFKDITAVYVKNSNSPNPILTINISDADGDLGFNEGKDTSYIYIKNLKNPPFKLDSFKLPEALKTVPKNNFKASAEIDIFSLLPATVSTRKDTIYYEVYVKDFAKNKSNVIKTDDPIIYITQ